MQKTNLVETEKKEISLTLEDLRAGLTEEKRAELLAALNWQPMIRSILEVGMKQAEKTGAA